MKRFAAMLAALALLICFAGCEDRANPYISRPQDSMLLYQREGGIYLTNTDAAAFTAEGSESGTLNGDIVPLASGSAYYLEAGTLYFKSYLEPAYKMTDGVKTVFYSIGSVFALTEDGKLLRTDDSNRYEVVLTGLSDADTAPFVECGNTVYAVADNTLYRLFYGGAPEKMKRFEGPVTFLSGNADEVYFAADGALWKCGHKAVAPKRLTKEGDVTPVSPEIPVSYLNKLFFLTHDGVFSVCDVPSGKLSETALRLSSPTARLLPEGATKAEVLVLTDGAAAYAYFLKDGHTAQLPAIDWVYAHDGVLYGFDDGTLVTWDGQETRHDGTFDMTHALATPDGYYFLTGPEAGYAATLWSLTGGKAEKIADNVWGGHAPRAVYRYGGISYFTASAIYIMDEETGVSETFADCEKVIDFVPRAGGAYALFEDGRLDVMIYSEDHSQTVAENVTRLFEALYRPERLTTYPILCEGLN